MAWKESVDLGRGLTDAGLDVEDGDAGLTECGETRTPKIGYWKAVGLGVIGC